MKGSTTISLCVAVMLFFGVCGATYAAEKIAYVDLSRVFDEYTKTKEYDEVLSKKQQEYEAERGKRLEKLQEAQGKLALLNDKEKEKLQEQLDKDKRSLMEFDTQQQTELRRERDEKIREILLEIEKVVREFAEKGKYSLILNDKVLIYANESLEITDQVIKLLNVK